MTILILGGTAEARVLAAELGRRNLSYVSSLAGRVSRPALPVGPVRVGGFGGIGGLIQFLTEHHVSLIIDATHPFASRISANAAAAARSYGCPLWRLERPSWAEHPGASTWTWVSDTASARQAGDAYRRPFLTTGRQTLDEFLPWGDRAVLVRLVDPPDLAWPPRWSLITARGPYDHASEKSIMLSHHTDVLITKDSGGAHTVGKLDAAAELRIPVLIVRRPPTQPGSTLLADVASVLETLEALENP